MTFVFNSLRNLVMEGESVDFIRDDFKRQENLDGRILRAGDKLEVNGKDVMEIVRASPLKEAFGDISRDALMANPMLIIFKGTEEDEFEGTKEFLDERYEKLMLFAHGFAQSFSLGCWFVKDSCVDAGMVYVINLFNTYHMRAVSGLIPTMSDGSTCESTFTAGEIKEAVDKMYSVYWYTLQAGSKNGTIRKTTNGNETVYNIETARSAGAGSFATAITTLQEARRTGNTAAKIDKYCSVLECLYAIKENHKKYISEITAAYIGADDAERESIRVNMVDAYGVRSDSSHGDRLKYLNSRTPEDLARLSTAVDGYVRRVFGKAITDDSLNYEHNTDKKANVRAFFKNCARTYYA